MPCDTIQISTVSEELKNVDASTLKKALESMGFRVRIEFDALIYSGTHEGQYYTGSYQDGKINQKIQQGSSKLDINQVKKAYSHQVVVKSAMSYGWKLTKTGKDTYTAQKG